MVTDAPAEPTVYHAQQWQPAEARSLLAQEAYSEPLAIALVGVLLLTVGRAAAGGEALTTALVGGALATAAAAGVAGWRLGNLIIEVHLAHPQATVPAIALITALDRVRGREEPRWFPLSYVNARVRAGRLSLTYHDRIVVIDPDHWPEFDAIARAVLLIASEPH